MGIVPDQEYARPVRLTKDFASIFIFRWNSVIMLGQTRGSENRSEAQNIVAGLRCFCYERAALGLLPHSW